MRQSRFTEAQIIGMIKEQEAGMPTAEVCRRHGLSPASFYKFKAKYGGMRCPVGYCAAMSREGVSIPRPFGEIDRRTILKFAKR
jgi:putative transposase